MLSSGKRRAQREEEVVREDWAWFGLRGGGGPASAGFKVPGGVFTHLNRVQLAARLPEPVASGKCWHPAFSTAGQQDSPSLTTVAPGSITALASFSPPRLRKPLTTLSRSRLGFLSA